MHQACADKGVHTLLAVKGTSQMLPAGSDDDHFSNQKSMGREVGAVVTISVGVAMAG